MATQTHPISFQFILSVFAPLARAYACFVREGGDPIVPAKAWEEFSELADELEEFEMLGESADQARLELTLSDTLEQMRRVIADDDLFEGMMELAEIAAIERSALYQSATRLLLADIMADISAVHTVIHQCASGFADCNDEIAAILHALQDGTLIPEAELRTHLVALLGFLRAVWVDDDIEIELDGALGCPDDSENAGPGYGEQDGDDDDDGEGFLKMPDWRGDGVSTEENGNGAAYTDNAKDALESLIEELPAVAKSYLKAYAA